MVSHLSPRTQELSFIYYFSFPDVKPKYYRERKLLPPMLPVFNASACSCNEKPFYNETMAQKSFTSLAALFASFLIKSLHEAGGPLGKNVTTRD